MTTAMPEQWTAIGKAQVDNALRIAEIASRGARKLADLHLGVAEVAFSDGVKSIKSLSEIKDVAEIPTWASAMMQPGLEKASVYAKSVYETASETSAELGAVFEEEFTKQLVIALDAATKSAPAGSEAAVAAVKSVIGVANGVYDTITKATKQLTAMTEANLAQAAGTAPRKAA